MFQKFSYKEIKKATDNFSTTIGQGGFGTIYKAHFSDGLVAAVKRMNKVSEQGEHEFCREIVLLARLHHRLLVSLRGFRIEKHERYTYRKYIFVCLWVSQELVIDLKAVCKVSSHVHETSLSN